MNARDSLEDDGYQRSRNEIDFITGRRSGPTEGGVHLASNHDHPSDCPCKDCEPYSEWLDDPTPLADHGKPLGLLGSLWLVLKGLRLYG